MCYYSSKERNPQCNYKKSNFAISLLPYAEADLKELLSFEDVEGEIVDISEQRIYIAVYRPNGIIHCISIPVNLGIVSRLLPGLSVGEKVFVELKIRLDKDGEVSIPFNGEDAWSKKTVHFLEKNNIKIINGRICYKRIMSYKTLLSLTSLFPETSYYLRKLYAQSNGLSINSIETTQARKEFEELYDEAVQIRAEATICEPEVTRDKIKELHLLINELEVSFKSKSLIKKVLDEAWNIQQSEGDKAYLNRLLTKYNKMRDAIDRRKMSIENLNDQIDDLEDRIANSNNEDYKNRARGWIVEKQEIIEDKETEIYEIESNCLEIMGKINDIRSRL